MTHRARGCPFITNVDGEDFVIDGFAKYKGYGDECKTIYFAGVALFQDEENKENGNLVFQFCFEYSYDTDEYKCYSKHFSDEIVENDFAYFIVENYERSCRNVKEFYGISPYGTSPLTNALVSLKLPPPLISVITEPLLEAKEPPKYHNPEVALFPGMK
ncbi:unnamed protein product [Bathycoccus prasinos]